MALYVVVGAGPVGRETARLLAEDGHDVRLVSRTGAKADGAGVMSVALDGGDGHALSALSDGAEAIFMCAMAAYHKWPTDFPPIMEGAAAAAENVGARLVVLGNIYGYGERAQSLLTSASPLSPTSVKGQVRVAMWERALAAKVPALEIRAGDYLGEGAKSLFTLLALPSLLAGDEVTMPGDLDVPHAWSFTRDVARTLVAASRHEGDWGRAFHVPSQHASIRDLASRFAHFSSIGPLRLRALTRADLDALGRDNAIMREVIEMAYLFQHPNLIDAADSERLLGVQASSLDQMIQDTLARTN